MPQISLFDFIEELEQSLSLTPTTAEVQEVCAALEPEVVRRPRPVFQEREWILKQAEGILGSVTISRIGRKHLAITPLDLDAALMLHNYRYSEADLVTERRHLKDGRQQIVVLFDGSKKDYTTEEAVPSLIRACIPMFSDKEDDHRVFFYFENGYGPDVRDTFLVRHLQQAGFNLVIPPSFERWVRKEWAREERELTPYSLPEIKDRRPLFDQMEEGLLVHCHTASGEFEVNSIYVVTKLTDPNGSDLGVQLQKLSGEGENCELVSSRITWLNNGPMEEVFSLAAGTETVYDPDNCLIAKYPREHAQMHQRALAMGLDLYKHTAHDAAQMALKRNGLNCKMQRMGKSSEAITTALLWGSKRIGVLSPSKDTRMEFRSELERLGETDYVMVDSVNDLVPGHRWYLMYFGFLKGLEQKAGPRGNDRWVGVEDAVKNPDHSPVHARCPHCNEFLVRHEYEPITSDFGRWRREIDFGYQCVNQNCSAQWVAPKVKRAVQGVSIKDARRGSKDGAAWWDPALQTRLLGGSVQKLTRNTSGQIVPDGEQRRTGSGYVDLERASVAKLYVELKNRSQNGTIKMEHPKLQFRGRLLPIQLEKKLKTQYVAKTWSPARYKRFRKFFNCLIIDEIHGLAKGMSTDQGKAILALQAKHKIGLTGTLMPNSPADPYWPCHWVFGGDTKLFPFFRSGQNGFTKYWKTFCKNVEVTNSQGQIRKKRLPIATAPLKQRKLHAPLIIRRTFSDPLVIESLQEKGFHYPTVHYNTVQCDPDAYQAELLTSAMDRFQQAYEDYREQAEGEGRDINTAYVLSSMSLLKVAATCPDFLNWKLQQSGSQEVIYRGVLGGGKTKEIRRIAYNKLQRGEKVVIVSFYKHELTVLMEALKDLGPTLYDIDNWDAEERFECRQRFLRDPDCRLLLGSINALQVGLDLSSADTVICADLLWSPGKQDQAVARILKPLKLQRDCDIFYMVLKHSLDVHVFNTFYAKRVASEQVMDGVISTPRPTDFNIRAFVDQVLAERANMQKYALDIQSEAINYIPLLNALATLDDRE